MFWKKVITILQGWKEPANLFVWAGFLVLGFLAGVIGTAIKLI